MYVCMHVRMYVRFGNGKLRLGYRELRLGNGIREKDAYHGQRADGEEHKVGDECEACGW